MQYKLALGPPIEIPSAKRRRNLTLHRLQIWARMIDEPDVGGLKLVETEQWAD